MVFTLVDLPQEILGTILSLLEPQALVSFGCTCRQAYSFINPSNQLLWRDAFLHVYDDPQTAWSGCHRPDTVIRPEWDWHCELRSRSLAIKTLRRRWLEESDRVTAEDDIKSILSIIDTAKCGPSEREIAEGRIPQVDDRSSKNLQLLTGILYDNEAALERVVFDSGEPTARLAQDAIGRPQTRAVTSAGKDRSRSDQSRRLHTLCGPLSRDKHERRHFYRRYVYDWALTNERTDFGPFDRDGSGRVNWMLLEAAMVCITQAFQEVIAGQLTPPTGLWSSIPYRTRRTPGVDWAGVTGTWLGTYAFLDYSRLLAFNAGLIPFDLRDEREVCGDLLRMELQLDDSVRADRVLRTNVPICEDLPPLYFTGQSRGTDYPSQPRTSIKGFAALTAGGREVKWKFIVEYHGINQWQLEGLQPGGIQSGGIFGVWSNVEHEPNSPVGPFCYFPQELCKSTSIVLAGTAT